MPIDIAKFARNRILAFTLFATSPAACLAAPPASEQADVAVVAKLYKDFAWQALGSMQDLFGKPLQQQSESVLRQYFDPGLAALFLRERECVSRRREVCNMDFDPLFASQDAAATDFSIQRTGIGKVSVTFTYPSNGEKLKLDFLVKQAGKTWRIHDVVYTNLQSASLKTLLSTKLPD